MLGFALGALISPAIGKRFGLENTLIAGLVALVVIVSGRFLRSRPGFMHLLWSLALAVLLAPTLPFTETPGGVLRSGINDLLWDTQEPLLREAQPAPELSDDNAPLALAELDAFYDEVTALLFRRKNLGEIC